MRQHTRHSFGASHVELTALPPGTLAVWLRIGRLEAFAVNDIVPPGAVAGIAQHLRSHASDRLAEAMGLTKCLADECSTARSWLPPVVAVVRSAV